MQDILINRFNIHSENNAIATEYASYSYKQLITYAWNKNRLLDQEYKNVGILAYREVEYYGCVLLCTITNRTFTPLGVKLPEERLKLIISEAKIQCVVYSKKYEKLALTLSSELPDVNFICISPIESDFSDDTAPRSNVHSNIDGNAYIIFTSGSTGKPKGVPISRVSLNDYLSFMVEYCQLNVKDRCSQLFEPTFDLSIHDIFVTWLSGACLYVVPESQLLAPAKFVKDKLLTSWFSVPTTAAIMAKLGLLKPNSYPTLRLAIFCGEALSSELAKQFQLAAPNARIINVYGPTETTIACSCYEIKMDSIESAIVPIGKPFPKIRFSMSEIGELLIGGSQVFQGYIGNSLAQETYFFTDENGYRWYRSGDLVYIDDQMVYHYIARIDDQVKIQGHRIELEEISCLIRKKIQHPLVFCIATPKGSPSVINAFIVGSPDHVSEDEILNYLLQHLPNYMIPKKFFWLQSLPMNTSGKVDKKALHKIAENT